MKEARAGGKQEGRYQRGNRELSRDDSCLRIMPLHGLIGSQNGGGLAVIHTWFAKAGLALLLLALTTTQGQAQSLDSADIDAFQVADQVGTRDSYQAYLNRFPNGIFRVVAQERVRPPLLTDLLPRLSPRSQWPRPSQKVWEEAWNRVRASDTEAGYLEYLSIQTPNNFKRPGEDVAVTRYEELTQLHAASVPATVSCAIKEADPKVAIPFKVERSVPQKAIDEGDSAIIRGYHVVSPSGRPLAYVTLFSSSPIYVESNRNLAMQMGFYPARRNCVNVAARYAFGPIYILDQGDGGTITDSRPTREKSIGLLAIDGGAYEINLPADKALLADIPAVPEQREQVWRLQRWSSFPVLVNVLDHEGQPKALMVDGLIMIPSGCPGMKLRFSAPDDPDPYHELFGRPKWSGPPLSGKFKIALSLAYDGPAIPRVTGPPPNCSTKKPS